MTITGFLRGINVGGHHKVPMAELRKILSEAGCENVRTLLNSGNVVFETEQTNLQKLHLKLENQLANYFGFSIPLILRTKTEIENLIEKNPFKGVALNKDIRLYVSFLKAEPEPEIEIEITLPYFSKDKSFQIISIHDRIICSVLDLSATKSPKGMEELEKLYGKNITTRNLNTVLKIADL